MNWDFDHELVSEMRTFIKKNCSNINDIWAYMTELFQSYRKAEEYDQYRTIYHVIMHINKQNHIKGLMTLEEVLEYLYRF